MNVKKVAAFIIAALTCICCVACNNNEVIDPSGLIETAPPLEAEKTVNAEQEAFLDLMEKAFYGVEPNAVEDFWIQEQESGVTITNYVGVSDTLRVPSEINGKPVTAIAENAFAGKTILKKIYLPDSIESIGSGALLGCRELTALRIPFLGQSRASEQYLGYLFGAESYRDNSRDVPASLQYLELGEGIEEIPAFALFDCNDLISVRLPSSVKRIGAYAFYNCTGLCRINTQELVSLEERALLLCSSLTSLTFGPNLVSIGIGALESCDGLLSLTLPFVGGSHTENSYLAYIFGAEVPDFSQGYYPKDLTRIVLLEGCNMIGNYAFYECETLRSVHLPEGITSIGIRAFYGCASLTELVLPQTLTAVRENAFFGCLRLQTVTVGNQLTSLGINTFYNCISLHEIVLPQSLKSIPSSCFADCHALTRVELGGVTEVGANAFHNCYSLREVVTQNQVRFEKGNDYALKDENS